MKSTPVAAALLAAVLLGGCANTSVAFRAGAAPAAGSSYQSATVHAELNSNPYFSLLFLGAFAAGVERSYIDLDYGADRGRAPPLDANRAIVERDCSQPLAPTSANLRCK